MKEDKVSFSVFAKQASKIFKRPDFQESELASMMKEMLQQGCETSNNEDTKSVMSGIPQLKSDEETFISLERLSLLVDLYHYFPIMRKQDRNLSTELYYILSSNKKGQAYDSATRSGSSQLKLSDKPSSFDH